MSTLSVYQLGIIIANEVAIFDRPFSYIVSVSEHARLRTIVISSRTFCAIPFSHSRQVCIRLMRRALLLAIRRDAKMSLSVFMGKLISRERFQLYYGVLVGCDSRGRVRYLRLAVFQHCLFSVHFSQPTFLRDFIGCATCVCLFHLMGGVVK